MNQEIQKYSPKMIMKCGMKEFNLSESEFKKIDKILSDNVSQGFLRLESGEWINLARVSTITLRKNEEQRIFGENIKI